MKRQMNVMTSTNVGTIMAATNCASTHQAHTGKNTAAEEELSMHLLCFQYSFSCDCLPGYDIDPHVMLCADVNECLNTSHPVCEGACENSIGLPRFID